MQPLTKNLFGRGRAVSVVFFGAFYLFLWLCIKPHLIYHYFEISRKAPFFKTGWLFLQDSLGCPGGLSQYIAAFFTQLCCFPWLGALFITLSSWLIYQLTASLATTRLPARQVAADSPRRVICYVPALLVLMVCSRYECPLRTAVAVLVVGFFSVLYKKVSLRLGPARVILFLIVCGAMYWLAGSAALVFVALAALCELFDRRKFLFSMFYLLLGPAVCWILGAYVFQLEAREIYLYSSPFIPIRQNPDKSGAGWSTPILSGFEESLFVALPVIVLLANSGRWLTETGLFSRKSVKGLRIPIHYIGTTEKILYRDRLRPAAQIAILALVAVPSIWLSFDRDSKKTVQLNYFNCRKMWPKVLTVAQEIPMKRYFPFCPHDVNRALYNTGRLGDQMFVYPQNYFTEDLVFSSIQGGNVVFMDRAEMCLELGLVNVAEKIAYEFLGGADDSPFILKQLALINIVKGRIETPINRGVFLPDLSGSRNLIYAKEAKELLKLLESDPQLNRDKQIRHIRSVMMTSDYPFGTYNEGDWLEELLRRNRYNRMAFEYLIPINRDYLLTRQLDKFIENLTRLDDFGYKSVPQHYQEAVVLYTGAMRKNVDLGGRKMSTETVRQYNELNKIGEQLSHNADVAWRGLAPRLGRTYYFYFTFGMSGVWQ